MFVCQFVYCSLSKTHSLSLSLSLSHSLYLLFVCHNRNCAFVSLAANQLAAHNLPFIKQTNARPPPPTSQLATTTPQLLRSSSASFRSTACGYLLSTTCVLLSACACAVPTAIILGGPDLHVDKGSTINLTCTVKFSPEPPAYIFWYHHEEVIKIYGYILCAHVCVCVWKACLPAYLRLKFLYTHTHSYVHTQAHYCLRSSYFLVK